MTPVKNLLLALVFTGLFSCQSSTPSPAPVVITPTPTPTVTDPIEAFIRANPTRSAITLVRNDTTLVSLRADQKFPLASTVKVIITIEFARQVASGKIDPKQMVPVKDLDVYYISGSDGGAHLAWKAEMDAQKQISNNRVPLLEVAKGMIRFSSNANAEYLLDLLGPGAVNANLATLNLPQHEPVIYLVALNLLYSTADKATTLQTLRAMSVSQYEQACQAAHARLKADTTGALKQALLPTDAALDQLEADRLPASTTVEYTSILQKINRRTYFAPAVQTVLEQVMEWFLIAAPANKAIYQRFGMKGGGAMGILTNTVYTTTLNGTRTEFAVFFKGLTMAEYNTLSNGMNTFIINCTQGANYQQVVKNLTP